MRDLKIRYYLFVCLFLINLTDLTHGYKIIKVLKSSSLSFEPTKVFTTTLTLTPEVLPLASALSSSKDRLPSPPENDDDFSVPKEEDLSVILLNDNQAKHVTYSTVDDKKETGNKDKIDIIDLRGKVSENETEDNFDELLSDDDKDVDDKVYVNKNMDDDSIEDDDMEFGDDDKDDDDLKVEYSDLHSVYVQPPSNFEPVIYPNRKADGVDVSKLSDNTEELTIKAHPRPYPYKYPHGLSSWFLGGIYALQRGSFWENLASDQSLFSTNKFTLDNSNNLGYDDDDELNFELSENVKSYEPISYTYFGNYLNKNENDDLNKKDNSILNRRKFLDSNRYHYDIIDSRKVENFNRIYRPPLPPPSTIIPSSIASYFVEPVFVERITLLPSSSSSLESVIDKRPPEVFKEKSSMSSGHHEDDSKEEEEVVDNLSEDANKDYGKSEKEIYNLFESIVNGDKLAETSRPTRFNYKPLTPPSSKILFFDQPNTISIEN